MTRRRRRIAVSVVFAVTGATFATWATRVPALADRLGLSEGQVGIALFGLSLGALVGLPAAGSLASRMGSRTLTRLALGVYCVALVGLAAAPGLASLTAILVVFGLGNSGVDVGMSVQAVETERSGSRPLVGSFNALFSLGGLAGGAAGTAAAAGGVDPLAHFGAAALVLLLLGLAATAGFEEPPRTARPAFALPTRPVVLLGVVAFAGFFAEGVIQDWAALYLERVGGSGRAIAAGGVTAFLLAMAVGRLLADWLMFPWGPSTLVRVAGAVAAVGLVGLVIVPAPPLAPLALAVTGLGLSVVVPVVFSLAGHQEGVPTSQAVAAVSTLGYLAFLAGPAVVGAVAGSAGLRWAFGLLVAFAVVLFVLGGRLPARHPLRSGG